MGRHARDGVQTEDLRRWRVMRAYH